MIRGTTSIIAHIGYPTHTFKSPMIYNPYFAHAGIDAVVVPMACRAEHFATFLPAVFNLENVIGALITMPHKVTVVELLDHYTSTVRIAGACNAVRRLPDGKLIGDLFDGEGFVRGAIRKGCKLDGARALVVGCGGVGSAIAASLARAGVTTLGLYDTRGAAAQELGARLAQHHPQLRVTTGSNDPGDYDVVVNASPLGMNADDPLPMEASRILPQAFVGEVVLKEEMTPFLRAAQARGCRIQVGTDMLFEQIPAYLEFFGLPTTTAHNLRTLAQLDS